MQRDSTLPGTQDMTAIMAAAAQAHKPVYGSLVPLRWLVPGSGRRLN